MFELSALGRGWGDFAATTRAELVVSDEVGRQVQLARHRAVRRGKRLQPPPVLEVWPALALPPIHWEIQGRPTLATPGSTALFNLVFGAAKFTAATAAAHRTTWKQLRAKILNPSPVDSKNATTNPLSIGTPLKVL